MARYRHIDMSQWRLPVDLQAQRQAVRSHMVIIIGSIGWTCRCSMHATTTGRRSWPYFATTAAYLLA
jgi:hypothetical protein